MTTALLKDPKVAILLAAGFEEVEALTPYDLLYRTGVSCELVAIGDRRGVVSSHQVEIVSHAVLGERDLNDYDMIILPGGMPGTTHLKANPTVRDAVTSFIQAGKHVAAICAAPSILAELGLLEGIQATSNPGFHQVLTEHGAQLLDEPVVCDGVIITSQGAGTAMEFGLKIVEVCAGSEAVETVKKGVVLV